MIKRFQSLLAPVLPPHFGFAVFDDATGDVLHHSDVSRVLTENFFDEADRDPALLNLVQHRREGPLNANYVGKSHHFFVKPIEGLPWTAVVFYERSFPQTINFGTGLLSFFWAVLYLAYLILIGAIVAAVKRVHEVDLRWGWIWPDPGDRGRYLALLYALPCIGVIAIISASVLEGWRLLVVVLSLPLITISLHSYLAEGILTIRTRSYKTKRFILAVLVGCICANLAQELFAVHEVEPVFYRILTVLIIVAILYILLGEIRRWANHLSEKQTFTKVSFQFLFFSVGMLTLFTLSVPAAIAIHRDSFGIQAEKLVKYLQLSFALAIDNREQVYRDELRRLRPGIFERDATAPKQMMKPDVDTTCFVVDSPMYDPPAASGTKCSTLGVTQPVPMGKFILNLLAYTAQPMWTAEKYEEDPFETKSKFTGDDVEYWSLADWLDEKIFRFNLIDRDLPRVLEAGASDARWSWFGVACCGEDGSISPRLRIQYHCKSLSISGNGDKSDARQCALSSKKTGDQQIIGFAYRLTDWGGAKSIVLLMASNPFEGFAFPEKFTDWGLWLLLIALSGLILYLFIRSLANRVLVLDIPRPILSLEPLHEAGADDVANWLGLSGKLDADAPLAERLHILLQPKESLADDISRWDSQNLDDVVAQKLSCLRIGTNKSNGASNAELLELPRTEPLILILTNMELVFDQYGWRQKLLQFLDWVQNEKVARVILLSELDP